MENSGEAADDQGSGWFEVKKVFLFCHFLETHYHLIIFLVDHINPLLGCCKTKADKRK